MSIAKDLRDIVYAHEESIIEEACDVLTWFDDEDVPCTTIEEAREILEGDSRHIRFLEQEIIDYVIGHMSEIEKEVNDASN